MTVTWIEFAVCVASGMAAYALWRLARASDRIVSDAMAAGVAKLEAELAYKTGLLDDYQKELDAADRRLRDLTSTCNFPNLVPGMPKHKYPRVSKLVDELSRGRALPIQFMPEDGERLIRMAGMDPESCGIEYRDGASVPDLLAAIELELLARER